MKAPRSVYVHVPFCRHHCGYCNFTLVADRDYLIDDYLQALEIEISQVEGRPLVDTIYLGGGTPSRLPARALSFLLKMLDQRFQLAADGEFTIEVNPEDLPGDIDEVIADSPINRISLGIQSFHAEKLRSLDRPHDVNEIERAMDSAHRIVDRISLDLIFAAPHDSSEIWSQDLQRASASPATHISTYELTYEKGTRFWNQMNRQELTAKDDETCAQYYEDTIEQLTAAGFEHYEISSFAKAGHRSRHNLVYWSGAPYLAFGPGASGLVANVRYTNHRSVNRYLNYVLVGESAIQESTAVSDLELALDRVVFGLRRIEGVDLVEFQQQTGISLDAVVPDPVLDELASQGLIELDQQRLKLTQRGLLLGDTVCSRIMGS